MQLFIIQPSVPSLSWAQIFSPVCSKPFRSTARRQALPTGKNIPFQPLRFYIGDGTTKDSEPDGNKIVNGVLRDVVEQTLPRRSLISKHHAFLQKGKGKKVKGKGKQSRQFRFSGMLCPVDW